ncbi:hypothetical protein [Corynebacterium otitidis]
MARRRRRRSTVRVATGRGAPVALVVAPAAAAVIGALALGAAAANLDDGEPEAAAGNAATRQLDEDAPTNRLERPSWSLADENDAIESFISTPTGSQVTYLDLRTGEHTGSATEYLPRPALSLGKLYLADYVLANGTVAEKYDALEMIVASDDAIATELYDKYPESISQTARKYGLVSTVAGEAWGESATSSFDVVRFVAELLADDPTHPILLAMAAADEEAADGYTQDFGTARIKGAVGSKWGWSNDRGLHSSVTFGEGFVAAAAVAGSADDLDELVDEQLGSLKGVEVDLSDDDSDS